MRARLTAAWLSIHAGGDIAAGSVVTRTVRSECRSAPQPRTSEGAVGRMVALFLAALGTLATVPLAAAAACSGSPPHWCANWKEPNEPFYNCSGSSELDPVQCTAWQELYDKNGGSSWID